ncbi:putative membrane protein [Propionispora sp. 2/2-37]|uniref:TVP38/TMEM64 family protein n=1 Tax=Propionispora sp. 2/2-37 TaxID=1677858 RepID=UPI0006BB60C5|nr:VTT domain-containing protein [Propionispora sp. 2/2-37]CUH95008.1 putative membrane protein [Propionispora sp. 2/2-37]
MQKLWNWFFIFAVIGLVYLWQPDLFQYSYYLLQQGDILALADYLRSFGLWSLGITLLLFVVMTFTIVFPFMILSGAAGLMYGLFWGTVISWTGEVIGAVVMFVVVRYFFRHTVDGWITKSRYLVQLDEYSATNGFKALLLARLLPLAPSGIITAIAAVSRMSFRDFFWASFLGKLPPVIIKVLLGHDLALANDNMVRLLVITGLVIGIYTAIWYRNRKGRKAENGREEE